MLLKVARWGEIQDMPTFERDHYCKEFAEFYTDKETGKVTVPIL